MKNTKTWIAAAAFAALTLIEAVAPAAAQPWGGPPPPRREFRDGPGWDRPHWRPHRERCWIEERRVRVMTPWGPRWRTRDVRVCR